MAPTQSLSGAPVAPVGDPALIGVTLDGYTVDCVLSMGGMGVVYRALHPVTQRSVAIKVLRPELTNRLDIAGRFSTEAEAMSRVIHPNIVQVLNFGQLPDGQHYLMMELVHGDSLKQLLERTGRLPMLDALSVCEQLLKGLAAAHGAGVVHRDLKPGNVMVTRDERGAIGVKLLDFGLARIDTVISESSIGREGRSSTFAGTPEYIAPEQAGGFRVDTQGDLYSLGVMLFEMLSGRLPFVASSTWGLLHMHSFVRPPRLSTLLPDVPKSLDDFIDQLLMKDSAARPASAAIALATVRKLVRSLSRRRPMAVLTLHRRRRVLKLAVAGAMCLAAVVGWRAVSHATAHESSPAAALVVPVPPVAPRVEVKLEVAVPAGDAALVDVTEIPPLAPVVPKPVFRRVSSAAPMLRADGIHCEANDAWRAAMHERIEDLEQRALAGLHDDAPPAQVQAIKEHVKVRSAEIRSAQGAQCRQVEARINAWSDSLAP